MPTRGRERVLEYRCFFVTTTCIKWLSLLQHEETKEICYQFLEQSCEKHNADIIAYAIMPDHLHLIVYFDEANRLTDFMREFKQLAAFHIIKWLKANKPNWLKQLETTQKGQRYRVWKDRFDDIHIRSRKIMEVKLNYIHMNPVDADLCGFPNDYEHSSARFYFEERPVRLELLHYHEVC